MNAPRWQKITFGVAGLASIHHGLILGLLTPEVYGALFALVLGGFGYANIKEKKLTKE